MNLNFLITSLTLALTKANYLRGNKVTGTFQSDEPLPPHQCLFYPDICGDNANLHGIQTTVICVDEGNARLTYPSLTNNKVYTTLTFEGKKEMSPCSDPFTYYLSGRLWFSGEDPRTEQFINFQPELLRP